MRALLVFVVSLSVAGTSLAEPISGAGSSAAYPVYREWLRAYSRAGGAQVNYEPAGSSAGVQRIKARQVDFAGTDVALRPEDLAKDGLLLFPTVISGVVPVFNLPRIKSGQILVTGDVLAKIFLGQIRRWDAKEIRDLNPQTALPAMPIVPVVRADGSGTTYNFADYLAKASTEWREQKGIATSVKWPEGFAQEKGSQGVVTKMLATVGAIGYVDYGYLVENPSLRYVQMRNAAGRAVAPSPESFRSALRASAWSTKADFNQTLTEQPGASSWPITMGTFIVLPKVAEHPEQARSALRFFTWAFVHGDELAARSNFVRLPDAIQAKAFRILSEVVDRNGAALALEGVIPR